MGIYLVTGACGGMGSAICALLSSKGHRVFGLDRRAPSDTPLWTYLPADVTDGETLEAALSRVREERGRKAALAVYDAVAGHVGMRADMQRPADDAAAARIARKRGKKAVGRGLSFGDSPHKGINLLKK